MSKPLLYGIFIVKFLFGLALIGWTLMVVMSSDVGLDDDNAFLSTYHHVDRNFNGMVNSNIKFENKYNLKFYLNDEVIDGLTVKDVFLSQRVIKNRKNRKNILKIGKNHFSYTLTTKDKKEVDDVKMNMLITMTTNHIYDKRLDFKKKTEIFNIDKQGYWNITGSIEIGDDKGYFFIKTNAK